ncbi:MAG: single-stranded-DNA-specific exonuclease RecJ [bacterium]|nr:single-stranded-DNA-specific exonuclease RecJ [bacterium]
MVLGALSRKEDTHPEKSPFVFGVNQSLSGKQWCWSPAQERNIENLSQRLSIPEFMARLLAIRGIQPEEAPDFLSPTLRSLMPDPFHLKGMEEAVSRTVQTIESGKALGVFGDYDVDGATSTALMVAYFRTLGLEVFTHIPDRIEEGYGPNFPALKGLHDKGADVVFTLDCGTLAFEPLEQAAAANVDVIVIDHHAAQVLLPDSIAVINPNRVDQESSVKNLAAVGVTFLFLVALNKTLREKGFFKPSDRQEPGLLSLLDLVALGTVCDVVPLTGLNRAFVMQGLKILSTSQNLGLQTLMEVTGVSVEDLSASSLGFSLGPRINAGGRVGEAGLGVTLLTTREPVTALMAATRLNGYNQHRQEIEVQVLAEASAQAEQQKEKPFLLLASDAWHPGVIGIVAGRLKDRYHRPVAVVALDLETGLGKASARSVRGFDLGACVHKAVAQELLIAGGGHAMAAGFSCTKEGLEDLHDFLCAQVGGLDLTPRLKIDTALSPESATVDSIEDFMKLAPFGAGNPAPRFAFDHLCFSYVKWVGAEKNHAKCTLQSSVGGKTLDAMVFRARDGPFEQALQQGPSLYHVVGTLSINRWGGREIPQLIIEDIAEASS